ncbi:MAG: hypothetical protein ACE5E6_09245 [Phycisphaerae bacterium]
MADASNDTTGNERLVTPDADKDKAKKWFQRALELGEKRQYDYAIQYYVEGLEYWPDAVDAACKPLHGCAVARKQTGGGKPGLKETMKRSMTHKDAKQALLHAFWLFGHDPDNISYIDGVVKNACRLRADDTAMWAGGVMLKAVQAAAKPNVKQLQTLVTEMESLGDRAAARGEATLAESAYRAGIEALDTWQRRFPKDQNVNARLRDLSTKLTIHKGKYRDSGSYRDSIADKEAQAEIHDRQRTVQAVDRVRELIEAARRASEADPDANEKFNRYIDLLCRPETDECDLAAIGELVKRFKAGGDYRHKQRADNIRMRQLNRQRRALEQAGDRDAVRQHVADQLRYELTVFKERAERYPTDLRIRYDYGVRLFRAGRYDDAIPMLQGARNDPKNRSTCGLYLGRCFFKKAYYDQAIATLAETADQHEYDDDDIAKALAYWLGRSQEAGGWKDDARKTYGKILQVDYTYRDARARLDGLPSGG